MPSGRSAASAAAMLRCAALLSRKLVLAISAAGRAGPPVSLPAICCRLGRHPAARARDLVRVVLQRHAQQECRPASIARPPLAELLDRGETWLGRQTVSPLDRR